ncbi:MAG: hypothetical protein ABGZ35_23055, partial [Planctomycetaceae bacterium]
MIVLVFAGMCCPTAAVAQTTEYAIHIDLDSDGRIQVDAVDFPPADDLKSRPGLLIWTENGLDRWQVFPAAIAPQSPPQQPRLVAQLSSVSRGDTVAAPEVISLMTVQLDQLIGAEVLRGVGAGGIFTPANDMMHLNGSITVRRLPAENGEEYPESELVLRPEGGEPIRVSFPKGRSKLKWTEIQDLPTSWQDGLPPGEYSLSYADGGDPVIFGIEEEKYRHAALHHADQLRKVTGEATPTWLQLTVESLLNAKDGDGLPAPYHADAYDLLEDVPTETLPIHLRDVREQLLAQLRGDRVEGSDRDIRNATGIPAIDLARKLVERGRWI